MIRSVSFDQAEILDNIMTLLDVQRFDADLSFGNGGFYKNITEPLHKFDIDPQRQDVTQASSTSLPLEDASIQTAVFDPPFLTYIKAARDHNSIMAKRFGGYWSYNELEAHYIDTLKEAHRVIQPKGCLVFKCQDIVHNHKLHPTHINVTKWADGLFRLKDLFILAAKSRMAIPEQQGTKPKKQKHARIFHSYFLVLERLR